MKSRPTHLLRHQHRVIEQAMRALEGICFRMRAGEGVPDGELSKLLYFIRDYADGFHHAKEEIHLFPALEQAGIRDENGPLAFLRNEHETERRLLGELDLAIEEYHRDSAAGEKFVSAALQFKDHLIGHIEQEDAILFRLAEEMLEERTKDSLIRDFAYQNADSQAMTQRYEQVARELEMAWAV
jgi:hemerythrin-like domain-containing protein